MAAASRVGVTVAGTLTTILIARALGPSGWGSFFVAQTIIAVLAVLTTLGAEHGIAFFVSRGVWAPRAAYQSALKMAGLMGCVGAGIGLGLRLLVPSAFASLPVWLTGVVVVALPFGLACLYASFVALASDHYEAAMIIPTAQAFLILALATPGAFLLGLKGAVLGLTLSAVILGTGSALWVRRKLPFDGTAQRGQLRRALSFGVKGYAANALQLLNYRLDLFVLSAVASTAVLGRYSLAVAVTTVLWLLPNALSDVLFPRVARLSHEQATTLEMLEAKSLRHATLLVAAGALLLAAGLELLVVPVFGEAFRPSVDLGLILLPGAAAIGVSTVLSASIVGRGKPVYSLYVTLITTPMTLALYATLIPWLHATGAALASTLSYIGGFALSCRFYRKVTGRPLLPLLMPTRSEIDDLRALPGAVAVWAAGRWK
jgi:O-antigen/teichoic acid export membrane protein